MTFTVNKEYSKSTKQAPRNTAKASPKLNKPSKRHNRHCCDILVAKFGQVPHPCEMLEQTFVCRYDVQLILKNVGRNKRSILNINLKKYPRQIQHPVIDLKMELLVKIVIDFKLQFILQNYLF